MALSEYARAIRLLYLASCVFNWFTACVVIGSGIWAFVHYELIDYGPGIECVILNMGNTEEEISTLNTHGYIFIFAGIVVSVVTFIGLYGGLKRNIPFIGVFLGASIFVVIVLVAMGVWLSSKQWSGELASKRDSVELITSSLARYDSSDKDFISYLQTLCECCGVKNGIDDYSKDVRTLVGDNVLCKPEFHSTPCLQKIFFYDNVRILFGLAFASSAELTISIVFCICFVCTMRDAGYNARKQPIRPPRPDTDHRMIQLNSFSPLFQGI